MIAEVTRSTSGMVSLIYELPIIYYSLEILTFDYDMGGLRKEPELYILAIIQVLLACVGNIHCVCVFVNDC